MVSVTLSNRQGGAVLRGGRLRLPGWGEWGARPRCHQLLHQLPDSREQPGRCLSRLLANLRKELRHRTILRYLQCYQRASALCFCQACPRTSSLPRLQEPATATAATAEKLHQPARDLWQHHRRWHHWRWHNWRRNHRRRHNRRGNN